MAKYFRPAASPMSGGGWSVAVMAKLKVVLRAGAGGFGTGNFYFTRSPLGTAGERWGYVPLGVEGT